MNPRRTIHSIGVGILVLVQPHLQMALYLILGGNKRYPNHLVEIFHNFLVDMGPRGMDYSNVCSTQTIPEATRMAPTTAVAGCV